MFELLQENQLVSLILIGVLCMLFLAVLVIIIFYYSRNKILQQKTLNQQMTIKHQDDLLRSNILIQEQERKRIAAELHDDIGTKLSVIRLYLSRLNKHDQKSGEILGQTNSILDTTIETARRISHELMSPVLDELGLQKALEEFVKEIDDAGSIKIILEINDPIKSLKKFTELQLFRIVQELVKNSINHSGASKIVVSIHSDDQQVQLRVKDDGKGADPSELENGTGLGMKNIQSRINFINADLKVVSEYGAGLEAIVSMHYE